MGKLRLGISIFLFGIITVINMSAYADEQAWKGEETMKTKVRIIIGGTTVIATMEDNPVARDFMSLMPLAIKMQDLANEEKYGNASRKLNIGGAKSGYDPTPGDICCYVPWGNVCIYYGDHGYESLVKLGKIEKDGVDALAKHLGDVTVSFEVMK